MSRPLTLEIPKNVQEVMSRYDFEVTISGDGFDLDDLAGGGDCGGDCENCEDCHANPFAEFPLEVPSLKPANDSHECEGGCEENDCGGCGGCGGCDEDDCPYCNGDLIPQIMFSVLVCHPGVDGPEGVILNNSLALPLYSENDLAQYLDESPLTDSIIHSLVLSAASQISFLEQVQGCPLPKPLADPTFEGAAEA